MGSWRAGLGFRGSVRHREPMGRAGHVCTYALGIFLGKRSKAFIVRSRALVLVELSPLQLG